MKEATSGVRKEEQKIEESLAVLDVSEIRPEKSSDQVRTQQVSTGPVITEENYTSMAS